MHNTIEERKKAFITLYHQNLDIIEIANALGVKVSELNKKTTWRGAIAFNRGRFSIIYNEFYVDNLFKRIEIIAHEMAHWIFDYDQIKLSHCLMQLGRQLMKPKKGQVNSQNLSFLEMYHQLRNCNEQ